MKFRYEYKTSSNERREGVISAPARDVAYTILRRQGIRASRVELMPGFMNRIAALGKRTLAIVLLAVALILSIAIGLRASRAAKRPTFEPSPRFVRLSEATLEVVGSATNGFDAARLELRRLFSENFDELSEEEREAAKTLYGEASLEIDRLSGERIRQDRAGSKKRR